MRWIAATCVLVAWLAYLGWLAVMAPEIEFLRPSLRGEWIVHASTPIRSNTTPVCPDAVFERRIVGTNVPSALRIAVSAFRGFRLDVNGAAVAAVDGAGWKRTERLDLLPYLREGTNVVRVTVFGTHGPPALLVEGPAEVVSGTNWTVAIGTARPVRAVVAGQGEGFLRERKGALWRHPLHRLFGWLFAAYCVFIAYALVPLKFKPWIRTEAIGVGAVAGGLSSEPQGAAAGPPRTVAFIRRLRAPVVFVWRYGICLVILLAVSIAQYSNVAAYPYTRSPFDARGHVDYVRLAAEKAKVPMATEGWEMFQPPAYYFAAATVYRLGGGREAELQSLKAVQVLGTTCGLLNLVFALGLLWLIFPDRPLARNLGFAAVAFLPVHFYMDPMVTNEVFAGAVIGGALLAACWAARDLRPPWIRMVSAVLACGIALLSKYTGLFLFLAVSAWLGLRALAAPGSVRAWGVLLSFVAGVLLVSGWYYQRNAAAYGNVFIGNWDEASGFHYEQPPGYRTAGFYASFGSVFLHEPERSRWASFWDGQYGSIWADSHKAFLKNDDPQAGVMCGVIICLALLPTAACLLGFCLAVGRLLRGKWDDPMLALVLLTFFTFVGVIAFTMEVPTYSTIKGFFLLSLIPAAAVFAGLGFEAMARQLGRLRWIMYGCMAAIAVLVLHVYRFVA